MGDSFPDPNPKIRAGQIACKQTRKLKITKMVHKLIHASQCKSSNCEVAQCEEMKTSVIHFKICTSKNRRECRNCRQLLALCRYHAKTSKDCESVQCVVPFCAHIKYTLKVKEQKKMQQPLPLPMVQDQGQQCYPEDIPQPASHPCQICNHPMQPNQQGIGPSADNVPNPQSVMRRQTLLQLIQKLKLRKSSEQRQKILSILEANPELTAALIRQRRQRRQQQNQQQLQATTATN